jgi:predicted deacylase
MQQWAYAVWNNLFFPNADMAIDLHTQTRGTAYPMFVFADYRNPSVKEMASYLNADQVKDDEGALFGSRAICCAIHTCIHIFCGVARVAAVA